MQAAFFLLDPQHPAAASLRLASRQDLHCAHDHAILSQTVGPKPTMNTEADLMQMYLHFRRPLQSGTDPAYGKLLAPFIHSSKFPLQSLAVEKAAGGRAQWLTP